MRVQITLEQARKAGFKVDYPANPRGVGAPCMGGPYGEDTVGYVEEPLRVETDHRAPLDCIWLVWPGRRMPVFLHGREFSLESARLCDEGKLRYFPAKRPGATFGLSMQLRA